jgi:hypothetical protein
MFFLSLSIARKYSILHQMDFDWRVYWNNITRGSLTGGDTSQLLRNTLCLIGFDFEGHCIPSSVNLSIVS